MLKESLYVTLMLAVSCGNKTQKDDNDSISIDENSSLDVDLEENNSYQTTGKVILENKQFYIVASNPYTNTIKCSGTIKLNGTQEERDDILILPNTAYTPPKYIKQTINSSSKLANELIELSCVGGLGTKLPNEFCSAPNPKAHEDNCELLYAGQNYYPVLAQGKTKSDSFYIGDCWCN